MCIATEETCSNCGNKYWQGDLRIDFNLICDECRGLELSLKEETFDREEWIKTITNLQR